MNNLNVAKIQLNGSSYEINNGTNLNELLNKLKIQKNKVAIEVNGEIVEKNKYPNDPRNKITINDPIGSYNITNVDIPKNITVSFISETKHFRT